jgi:serine/threonine protein kinase
LGVCVLHINQVGHFDLNPANILIDEEDNLKLGIYKYILWCDEL